MERYGKVLNSSNTYFWNSAISKSCKDFLNELKMRVIEHIVAGEIKHHKIRNFGKVTFSPLSNNRQNMQFVLVCITLVVLAVACSATLQEQYDRLQKRALLSDPVTGMFACLSCYVSNTSYPVFCAYTFQQHFASHPPPLLLSPSHQTLTHTPSHQALMAKITLPTHT